MNQNLECNLPLAQEIIEQLYPKDNRAAKEVANYFKDMQSVVKEMHRILRSGGHVCIVIGNTMIRDVKIRSTEIFIELLEQTGFTMVDIIKRSIPYKLIPTIRDKTTGKFTKLDSNNSKLVYPEEYILIAKKEKK
jgi:DNA modification methylase